MKINKALVLAILVTAVLSLACKYIVLPEGLETQEVDEAGSESRVWKGIVTNVGKSETGDLRIDLAIRNDTGDWSKMEALAGKPAVLTTGDGKTTNCDTVTIGTGGHRLAPGFQTRGFTTGEMDAPTTQPLYVECKGVEATPGSTLAINYASYGGELDDYAPDANETEGVLELNLDEVVTDLTYPIATPVEGLLVKPGVEIPALSDNVITLQDVQRTESGFQFTWQNFNPTKFPLKTHIGIPPVIGADGIIYGPYETIDIPPIPITASNGKVEWTTEVVVPPDGKGFYILLSVESKKPRTYINYAVDISDK
jgi:hypothetical protein